MAARRLLIVLVLLLAASVVAASLAPNRRGPLTTTDSTTESTTTQAPPQTRSFEDTIDASAKKPQTVEGFVGEQLTLSVESPAGRTVAIEPLGLTEFAAPEAPARFDLLLREPGAIPITDADTGQVIGRLLVKESKPEGLPGGDGGGQDAPQKPETSRA